jgi:hypothetical protein
VGCAAVGVGSTLSEQQNRLKTRSAPGQGKENGAGAKVSECAGASANLALQRDPGTENRSGAAATTGQILTGRNTGERASGGDQAGGFNVHCESPETG